MILFYLFI